MIGCIGYNDQSKLVIRSSTLKYETTVAGWYLTRIKAGMRMVYSKLTNDNSKMVGRNFPHTTLGLFNTLNRNRILWGIWAHQPGQGVDTWTSRSRVLITLSPLAWLAPWAKEMVHWPKCFMVHGAHQPWTSFWAWINCHLYPWITIVKLESTWVDDAEAPSCDHDLPSYYDEPVIYSGIPLPVKEWLILSGRLNPLVKQWLLRNTILVIELPIHQNSLCWYANNHPLVSIIYC